MTNYEIAKLKDEIDILEKQMEAAVKEQHYETARVCKIELDPLRQQLRDSAKTERISMKVDNRFYIGQVVYLKTDPEQKPRIVTVISVGDGWLMYRLAHCDQESTHSAVEISEERDVVLATSN